MSSAPARRRKRPVAALEWRGRPGDGYLRILDQTRLPEVVEYIEARDLAAVVDAIRRLAVRGAPAIGCAAAYGMVLGLRSDRVRGARSFLRELERVRDKLAASRPTAVNLFWSLERMERTARSLDWDELGREGVLARLLQEARAVHEEDQELCRRIGEHGAALIESGQTVLTHCNAGALATGGTGTALAVVYHAAQEGKAVRVVADETRPLLQGARLTSWELSRAGIDVTLICDGAAASALRQGRVQCVVVGADRIARNGDVANKIGTYPLAVLAREHGVPFYVAAPSTTFDASAETGDDIPIEERAAEEVRALSEAPTAPRGVGVWNPAFDVTPARYVTAIITERGVLRPPYRRSIARLLRERDR